ncbi:MAG: hypothetical protein ACLR43_02690 [Faecalibacillus faecis]
MKNIKIKRGIYGVGIVDVAKMSRYEDVDVKDTLASQLDCKIHMLDGMPTCCFLSTMCR